MRLKIAAILAFIPAVASAGGHGVFYNCEANGIQDFTIEIAARDCQIGRAKAQKVGDNPDMCDFGGGVMGMFTMASDGAMTVEANGKTFNVQCRPR